MPPYSACSEFRDTHIVGAQGILQKISFSIIKGRMKSVETKSGLNSQ